AAPAPAVKPTVTLVPARPVPVAAPRVGKNPGLTRVVLDLPAGVTYTVAPSGAGVRVTLQNVSVGAASARNVSPELAEWRLEPGNGGAVLTLRPTFALGARSGYRSALLPSGEGSTNQRLVVDLSPALADVTPVTTADVTLPAFTSPVRIVLDPGHGGVDPGAIGSVVEKVVTLDVARRVRAILAAAGAEVVLTRETDTQISTDKQTDLAGRAAFGTPPSTLLVSIHVNSLEKNMALRGYGVETWWYPNDEGSAALAASLQSAVTRLTGASSRGVHRNSLAVLRKARVPAALVEIGFASHPVDGLNLQSPAYLDRVAAGIAWGIREFLLPQDALADVTDGR
ncbi:N-acetylmuramoyl-L-alanine amidase family protein, partial [Deinococcus pimensis]|uniref:N-acetylmuramoyl-L-alanine amidase family protein n=1 Tax=Deinococcus pimensis TaxID=309888 RepID=UPI0005EB0BBE